MSEADHTEKPPLFSSWNKWYLMLIVFTLLQLLLYYWMTRFYNYSF